MLDASQCQQGKHSAQEKSDNDLPELPGQKRLFLLMKNLLTSISY